MQGSWQPSGQGKGWLQRWKENQKEHQENINILPLKSIQYISFNKKISKF